MQTVLRQRIGLAVLFSFLWYSLEKLPGLKLLFSYLYIFLDQSSTRVQCCESQEQAAR